MKRSIVFFFLSFLCMLFSQTFTEIGAGLQGVNYSSVDWGDFDNDGDLDILLTGNAGAVYFSAIYRNDGDSIFTDISAGLPTAEFSSVDWGDFDSDGDLDVLLTGYGNAGFISRIYRNDSGSFININAGLTGVFRSSAAWGDYDNDGDLDVLLTGRNVSNAKITKIYRNDSGVFTDMHTNFPGIDDGSASWGDYDSDGDLDVLLAGNTDLGSISCIYRNDSGEFTDINAGLTGTYYGCAVWGDYDNDGDPDIILTGYSGSGLITTIYRNDSGSFTDINAGLQGTYYTSVSWGDCDNDGDLDILLSGYSVSGRVSKIFRNNSGVFTDINAGLYGLYQGCTAWGDYDNDGDLDVLHTGYDTVNYVSKIYRNESNTANTMPDAPLNLSDSVVMNDAVLTWDKAADTETPQNGLTYNIYIGTASGSANVKSPMSRISDGWRKISSSGNAFQGNSWMITGLNEGTYYWSVQSVDNGYLGSEFSAEDSFTVTVPAPPLATPATNVRPYIFTANWQPVPGASGYRIDVDDNSDFSSPLLNYNDFDTGDTLSVEVSGLSSDTFYYYRLRTYSPYGTGTNSNTISVRTPLFEDITAGLIGVNYSDIAYGDYDNDGDLDILLTGKTSGALYMTVVYRNDGNDIFTLRIVLTGIYRGSCAWGDYDNDGDLDILLTGNKGTSLMSDIYRNDGSDVFTTINAGFQVLDAASCAWGDYDNDGDLDVLLTGMSASVYYSLIYRNDSGIFTNINAGLTAVQSGSCAWDDYDNDGDLDIILTGYSSSGLISKIYRNDSCIFTDINAGLPGMSGSSCAWGDFDNDGDHDLLISGWTVSARETKIYRNDSCIFSDIGAGLTGVLGGSAAWGDYDNDGDLDILISGSASSTVNISKVYRNESGVFTDINAGLPGVTDGCSIWGDYDGDGDLDITIAGHTGMEYKTWIFNNACMKSNKVPSAPENLSVSATDSTVTFTWDKAVDDETPQNGLSYNISIGTISQESDIKDPMSNLSTGFRKVVGIGNTGQSNSWTVKGLTLLSKYVWSVQAVDHTFAGSSFAEEQSFIMITPPSNVTISELTGYITVTWNSVPGATGYKIYASTDPYGTYTDVSTQGTFDGTKWIKAIVESRMFYYVVAEVAVK